MYADFTYYATEYGGKAVKPADFVRLERKASRLIDSVTGSKLKFAFPTDADAVMAVKDCQCELIDFIFRVEQYQNSMLDSVGAVSQEDGTVKGKVISSVSSGSESISYSIGGNTATDVSVAAKDKKIYQSACYEMIKESLSCVADANGVLLLYAGPYPGKRELWV